MAIVDRIFGGRKENKLELDDPYEYKDDCMSCRVMGTQYIYSSLQFVR